MSTPEKPMLFAGELVRAILQGRKTQTRRPLKLQPKRLPDGRYQFTTDRHHRYQIDSEHLMRGVLASYCPFGGTGERLWVRETFYCDVPDDDEHRENNLYYAADGTCCDQIPECSCQETGPVRWRPSIHMSRWASRLTLEITGVEVQRLNELTEEDAAAEGVQPITSVAFHSPHYQGFARTWEEIYGADSWFANPYVWVIKFRKL